MDCKKAESYLSFYVFDELTPGERVPLAAHLQICGSCTRKLENYRVVQESLGELPEAQVPSDFLVGVRARLETPETWVDRVEEFLTVLPYRRALAGASLASVLGLAAFVGQSGQMALQQDRVQQEPDVQRLGAVAAPLAPSSSSFAHLPEGSEAPEEDAAGLPAPGTSGAPSVSRQAVEEKQVAPPESGFAESAPPARRSPASAFDDDFGLPHRESLQIPDRAPATATRRFALHADEAPSASPFLDQASLGNSSGAGPAPDPVASAPVVQESRTSRRELADAPSRSRSEAPPAPRLARAARGAAPSTPATQKKLRKAAAVPAKPMALVAADTSRDLDRMGPQELASELERLAPRTSSPREDREGLSIFAPAGVDDQQLLARMALEDESSDSFLDSVEEAPALAPLEPVSLAWVRTTFGRRVEVQDMGNYQPGPTVAREVSVRTRSPRHFLTGLRDLVEAGIGFELRQVVFRREQEVEVLLSFGRGLRGLDSLERFVENVRSLPEVDVDSDLSHRVPEGQLLLARFLVPNG